MANETQIANLALSWMGQDQINALTDNQTEAKIMNANYALARDKVLTEHAWTFALRREILTPTLPVPAFGSQNKFLIPSDVLRVHRVYRASNALQTAKFMNARWVREGQFILATEQQIWAHFIFRNVNSQEYSIPFAHAVAARLAADTCITFTENRRFFEQLESQYYTKLQEATASDGAQGRTEIVRSSKLTGVRTR